MKRLIAISVNILIYIIAQSQTRYSLSEQIDMLKTYTFYLGQKKSIDYIVEKFPTQKYETIKAQNNWDLRYLASIQNIVSALKDNLGEDFENMKKKF